MFGIAGIRGPYGKEITEELIKGISSAFAIGESKVAIARDIRQSGKSLKKAAIEGVVESGGDVFDLGIAPTPTVALASKKYGNGIMITASHNPIDHNGIKLMKNGRELTPDEGNAVYQRYLMREKAKREKTKGNHAIGRVETDESVIREHMELIAREVKVERGLKVVVDCNGAGAVITPYLLHSLGCKVISINTSLEEFFRPSEPKAENLTALSAAVRAMKADIGIAHDADADRCIIIDKNGEQIPMDVQLAMMIEEELSKTSNKNIAATVEASLLIRETVEKNGGKIRITPVGSTYLALEIEKGAYFAGEPCGEYIFSRGVYAPDGIMTAAKFAELASKKDLLELRKKYNHYPIARERYETKNKFEAMKIIEKEITKEYPEFSDIDGVRVDEEDGWFLVRPSGTESIIRLTMEYKDKNKLQKKKQEIEKIIKECLTRLNQAKA